MARLVNNVKYIALMDDPRCKLKSITYCAYHTLKDVFLNVAEETNCAKANELCLLSFGELESGLTLDTSKQIYNLLNSLTECDFYFVEGPFDETYTYVEYNVWLEQLQTLVHNLEKIIIVHSGQ